MKLLYITMPGRMCIFAERKDRGGHSRLFTDTMSTLWIFISGWTSGYGLQIWTWQLCFYWWHRVHFWHRQTGLLARFSKTQCWEGHGLSWGALWQYVGSKGSRGGWYEARLTPGADNRTKTTDSLPDIHTQIHTQKGLKGGQSLRLSVGNPSLERWISKCRHLTLSTLPSLISSSFFIPPLALQGGKMTHCNQEKMSTHTHMHYMQELNAHFCSPLFTEH